MEFPVLPALLYWILRKDVSPRMHSSDDFVLYKPPTNKIENFFRPILRILKIAKFSTVKPSVSTIPVKLIFSLTAFLLIHGLAITYYMPMASAVDYRFRLDIRGSGKGTVKVYPGGYPSYSINNDISVMLPANLTGYLEAAPSEYSVFSGWSGDCEKPLRPIPATRCNIVMDSNKTVNASFNLDPSYKVQIERALGDVYFHSLQSAINSAQSGETAKSRGDVSFDENILMDTDEYVAISGGYGTDYTLKSAASVLNGILQIKRGTLVVSDLIIAGGTDSTPPTVPTNLTGTVVSRSQINLHWDASTDNVGVTGYLLERCQGPSCTYFSQIATPATVSFNDTSLTPSTWYTYRVRARDVAGNPSNSSDPYSAITLANTSPPAPPASAAATALSATSVRVTWADASDNESGFRVLRGTGTSPSNYTQIGSDLLSNGTYFNDTTATANTTYVYRVTAFNAFGVSAPAQTAPLTTPTASGANLSGPSSATTGTPFTLSWTYSWGMFGSTAEGYQLQESTSSTFSSPATLLDTRNTGDRVSPKTFQVTKNSPGTYYYRVRANTIAGLSGWSNTLIVMVTQATSTTITLTAQYDNLVRSSNLPYDPETNVNPADWQKTVYENAMVGVGCNWTYSYEADMQFSDCFASLVKFNLSTLAGKTVDSATLKLVVNSKGVGYLARQWYVRALATSWSHTTATWDNIAVHDYYIASESLQWPPQLTAQESYEIDVTTTVRNWLNGDYYNYGLMIESADYTTWPYGTSFDAFDFYSKEDPAGEGPKLIVTYH
jgi:hypothetical protein